MIERERIVMVKEALIDENDTYSHAMKWVTFLNSYVIN